MQSHSLGGQSWLPQSQMCLCVLKWVSCTRDDWDYGYDTVGGIRNTFHLEPNDINSAKLHMFKNTWLWKTLKSAIYVSSWAFIPKFIYIIHSLCYVLFCFYNKLCISTNSSSFASQQHCCLPRQCGSLLMFPQRETLCYSSLIFLPHLQGLFSCLYLVWKLFIVCS